ncbi:unnamed protein product [Closterium sp. NIES-64]|nr:unnamed protein product [Closterium sp. NIES-64]
MESSRPMANSEDVIVPADLEDDVAGSASALRVSPWCAPWLWSAVKLPLPQGVIKLLTGLAIHLKGPFALATSLDIALSSFSLALVTRTFYSMWRVVLPVVGETEFELLGFILVMLASFMAGLRWVLLQVLLQYLAPVMALVCGIFSLLHEPWSSLASLPYFDTWPHALWTLAVMPVGGVLAFCMVGGLQLILTCAAIHQHEFR